CSVHLHHPARQCGERLCRCGCRRPARWCRHRRCASPRRKVGCPLDMPCLDGCVMKQYLSVVPARRGANALSCTGMSGCGAGAACPAFTRSHAMHQLYKAAAGVLAVAILAGWATAPARAQPAQAAAQASATASGEVRRVNPGEGTVTIKHGEIKALDLPAMTLVYRADPALLANIRPGDSVRFTATRQGGNYVITQIGK